MPRSESPTHIFDPQVVFESLVSELQRLYFCHSTTAALLETSKEETDQLQKSPTKNKTVTESLDAH